MIIGMMKGVSDGAHLFKGMVYCEIERKGHSVPPGKEKETGIIQNIRCKEFI